MSKQATKFGTFGGVFTPSILTILGVIMYLRLPWIVGNAGLWWTIGIILVSHIISITTGLSVASIATDKKVEAGGNYYIISRSLGLPIGGTLGIALFVGFSFSVSLYIIGFTESFLDYWNLPVSTQNIRIYGTITLLTVTAVTLFSTSLAIKMQYVIMVAIALSLISILFGSNELAPEQAAMYPPVGGVPIAVLFGIFFPAVTGFTTGVQMSGDLQDPKRSIPLGTMAAISVGFVVYIGLAIFLALRVDGNSLANDSSVLNKLSFFAPFLAAGIWGATISSAMGSILGAPRILQATSKDRITPNFFAKGYGPGNDPHHALILTFIIAEVGILIGELNLIARIISIFFITTYGFINLVCALENWAGPDFRPSFKIPTWVAVLGAGFCFFVMFELDPLALLGATILMSLLYAYLKRRELTLESGDTWEGIWSSVVRSGLIYLTRNRSHRRNWRPNILLFSGGSRVRPHLVEFGEWMVHKRGILTNFDLLENDQAEELFSKPSQPEENAASENGVFSRQLECRNIYEGIENTARVYGFSGIDPNTIMMGWARNSNHPERFTRMINHLMQLDYNILLLDYDREHGFGAKRRIDIWWRGGSNNATLSLTVLKFIQASPGWREAKARILLVVDDAELSGRVYKNMTEVLEEQRVTADILVINNSIEKLSFNEIIQIQSADADLTMIGLTEITPDNAERFVSGMDSLAEKLGNVLMVHASSYFETTFIGIEKQKRVQAVPLETTSEQLLPILKLPKDDSAAHQISGFLQSSEQIIRKWQAEHTAATDEWTNASIDKLRSIFEAAIDEASSDFTFIESENVQSRLRHLEKKFILECQVHFEDQEKKVLPLLRETLEQEITTLKNQLRTAIEQETDQLNRFYSPEELKSDPTDGFTLRLFKWLRRMKSRLLGKEVRERINWRAMLRSYYFGRILHDAEVQYQQMGIGYFESKATLQKWLEDAVYFIRDAHLASTQEALIAQGSDLLQQLDHLSERHLKFQQAAIQQMHTGNHSAIQNLCYALSELRPLHALKLLEKRENHGDPVLDSIPETTSNNLIALNRFTRMKISLLNLEEQLTDAVLKLQSRLQQRFRSDLLEDYADLRDTLDNLSIKKLHNGFLGDLQTRSDRISTFDYTGIMQQMTRELRAALLEIDKEYEILTEESFQNLADWQLEPSKTARIHLRRMLTQLIDMEFTGPLQLQLTEIRQLYRQSDLLKREMTQRLVRAGTAEGRSESNGDSEIDAELASTVDQFSERLSRQQDSTLQRIEELKLFTTKRIETVIEQLHPKRIIHSTLYQNGNRSGLSSLRPDEVTPGNSAVLRNTARSINYASRLTARLKKVNFRQEQLSDVERHYRFAEPLIPTKAMTGILSFSYRQLFTARQAVDSSLLVNLVDETEKAEVAIQRYRNDYPGGLLVLGEGYSGRTAFSRFVAERFFDKSRIYHLNAVAGGCNDKKVFLNKLSERLGTSTDYDTLFKHLPVNSVVIINDLELWWEKGPEGMETVRQIFELINLYSKDCFFVVNCNVFAFRKISEEYGKTLPFLDTIKLKAFDRDMLLDAVLRRHRSTGMLFSMGDQNEDQLSVFNQERLADYLMQSSGGNIGLALHSWIAMIHSIKGSILNIELPDSQGDSALYLPADQAIWLTRFLLHKELTRERMIRLSGLSATELELALNDLKRSLYIVENRRDILELNPWLRKHITTRLQEIGQIPL